MPNKPTGESPLIPKDRAHPNETLLNEWAPPPMGIENTVNLALELAITCAAYYFIVIPIVLEFVPGALASALDDPATGAVASIFLALWEIASSFYHRVVRTIQLTPAELRLVGVGGLSAFFIFHRIAFR